MPDPHADRNANSRNSHHLYLSPYSFNHLDDALPGCKGHDDGKFFSAISGDNIFESGVPL